MNRNNLKNNFQELITIEDESLWFLVKNCRDKRQQYQADWDYITTLRDQLKSSNPAEAMKAKEALQFLNAFSAAYMDGNYSGLKKLNISVTDELKKQISDSRNAAQRDYVSNNQGAQDELTDLINPSESNTIGSMVEAMQARKRHLRKQGRSVQEMYQTKPKEMKPTPLPVKIYSKEEIEKLNQQRKGNK